MSGSASFQKLRDSGRRCELWRCRPGERVGTGKAEMGQRPEWEIQHDSTIVEKLLKLCGCGAAVMCHATTMKGFFHEL